MFVVHYDTDWCAHLTFCSALLCDQSIGSPSNEWLIHIYANTFITFQSGFVASLICSAVCLDCFRTVRRYFFRLFCVLFFFLLSNFNRFCIWIFFFVLAYFDFSKMRCSVVALGPKRVVMPLIVNSLNMHRAKSADSPNKFGFRVTKLVIEKATHCHRWSD